MATNGIRLITPTSVDHTGTSATINAGGSVTFTACSVLSLNGVFSSTYDNYIIDCRIETSETGSNPVRFRFRLSGSDNTTASSYVSQRLRANSTTVSGTRVTADYAEVVGLETDSSLKEGFTTYVYGPGLAQPTAFRAVSVNAGTSAGIYEYAGTHNQSTGYDGFTFDVSYKGGLTISGLVKVYGLVQ